MKRKKRLKEKSKSIFRAIFAPLFIIMLLQAALFYFAAVYGGIEGALTQNASDVLSGRLNSRKYELETRFTRQWINLSACREALDTLYGQCRADAAAAHPFAGSAARQIRFLADAAPALIDTLRHNEVNGVFLILNDQAARQDFQPSGERKYGLCIRDMDPESNYAGLEDLLLERAPSSIVDALGCALDSWWEPKYAFSAPEQGDFYYQPLNAAWEDPGADGSDLAYFSPAHNLSDSDPAVVSYSLPLIASDGTPYGVLGVEISTRRLAALLPSREINQADKSCYVLAVRRAGEEACRPIVGSGALFNRCFSAGDVITAAEESAQGGFYVTARGGTRLYGCASALKIYNNNSPFEDEQLLLLALVESSALFGHIARIKLTLLIVALLSLFLGLAGILLVSRRFAAPITALAGRVRGMRTRRDLRLGRLGIAEIDLLVGALEELSISESKNSARTEFFSRMSHDMRTPMNAIISFSSPELLRGASVKIKDDYLQKIHASGEFLLALINEVLDMTKIESNKTELHLDASKASRLCETVIPIISEIAQKKRIRFTWQIAVAPGAYVLADEQHINQILMNLLSNAVKFTAEGGEVSLALEEAQSDDEKRMTCRFTVRDNGIGMGEDFMRRLYTPFEQENDDRGGTGLGLSIAKKLVELMAGDIACESRRGEGTVFTVTLPLLRCEAPRAAARPALPGQGVDTLRGKLALVCEDNAVNVLIAQKLLQSKGMRSLVAADGLAGVQAFEASAPGEIAVILMDIRMPALDGLEAARRIRALPRPDAQSVPIIAMTANAFDEDVRASREAGMNAHLAKPIEPQRLFDTLARYIR